MLSLRSLAFFCYILIFWWLFKLMLTKFFHIAPLKHLKKIYFFIEECWGMKLGVSLPETKSTLFHHHPITNCYSYTATDKTISRHRFASQRQLCLKKDRQHWHLVASSSRSPSTQMHMSDGPRPEGRESVMLIPLLSTGAPWGRFTKKAVFN